MKKLINRWWSLGFIALLVVSVGCSELDHHRNKDFDKDQKLLPARIVKVSSTLVLPNSYKAYVIKDTKTEFEYLVVADVSEAVSVTLITPSDGGRRRILREQE